MKTYAIPVVVEIEVSGELTSSEIHRVKIAVVSQLDYHIQDNSMVSDGVQELISVELKSLHVSTNFGRTAE